VRTRVLALAAERLSTLTEDAVPSALRPYRRFHPRRLVQLAPLPLAAALEADPGFRQLVAELLPEDVATAVRSGASLPAAPPEDLAAAAYLLRTAGWEQVVDEAAGILAERDRVAAGAAGVDAVRRLTEQLEALRAHGRAESERLSAELETAGAELVVLRRRVRDAGARAAAAERALAAVTRAPGTADAGSAGQGDGAQRAGAQGDGAQRAGAQGDGAQGDGAQRAGAKRTGAKGTGAKGTGARGTGAQGPGAQDAEVRRLQARLRTAEQALSEVRTGVRGDRHAEQVRLRVLLDALLGAAGGLRRELALPPMQERPADAVAAAYAPDGAAPLPQQGRTADDPALLDALLRVPAVHLLVDGYNVTKAGYGSVSLEQQRGRLVSGLGALAARTGAEVSVVFDGAGQEAGRGVPPTRGVRVLFSPTGVIADDVLLELVAAEPQGRPLVVVSSDREVADGVRGMGATPLPNRALLALLDR